MAEPRAPQPAFPTAHARRVRVDDALLILLASPVLGISVSWVTGILDDAPAGGTGRWLGLFAVAAIAFLIWHGNRFVYFWVRDRSVAKTHAGLTQDRAAIVIGCTVLFTPLVATGLLVLWYQHFAGGRTNWGAIQAAVALITTTALFLAHAYESILLTREQAAQRVAMALAERQHLLARVHTLEAQLDPHFMYNALCSLGFLIETNRERAAAYVTKLSSVYAYVTQTFTAQLVSLEAELDFARAYAELLLLRHGSTIEISIPDQPMSAGYRIVPISIQLALENAAKHNDMSAGRPLQVRVAVLSDFVEVVNNRQPLAHLADSLAIGLPNLSHRCRLCVARDTEVLISEDTFTIRIPLMAARD